MQFFILFILSSGLVYGGNPSCRKLKSLTDEFSVCWSDTHKGWVGSCPQEKCEAISFLKTASLMTVKEATDSKNPATIPCHERNIPVEILRDESGAEQSFCLFADKSLIDTNAIERVVP